MNKTPINKRRVSKLIIIIGIICLAAGLIMIPYNIYYWNHNVGCTPSPSFAREVIVGWCWGQEYGHGLDMARNILIIVGLLILIGFPIIRKLVKYLYTQDK